MTLAQALRLSPAGWRALRAQGAGAALFSAPDGELAERGFADGNGLTERGRAVARRVRTLTITLAVTRAEIPTLLPQLLAALDALLMARAETLAADDVPPLLTQYRLVKGARLTLRGAATLNTLEALARDLDAYLL